MINTFICSRSSFENHTQFHTLTLTPNQGANPNYFPFNLATGSVQLKNVQYFYCHVCVEKLKNNVINEKYYWQ